MAGSDQFSESVNQFEGATVLQPPNEPAPGFEVQRDPAETGGVVVVKDGYTVHHLDGPQEGYRLHRLQDVTSLAEWLLAHTTAEDHPRTEVFVSGNQATAVIDPRHHDSAEIVTGGMDGHPLLGHWRTLIGADGAGAWVSQKTLFAKLRVLKGTVDEGAIILQKVQKAGVIESMESETELNAHGGTTLRGTVGKKDSTLEIPETLAVKLPVYLDAHARYTAARAYDLEVIVETEIGDGGIQFRLLAPDFPALLRKAQLDVATYLQTSLGDAFTVVLGVPELESRSAKIEDGPA